MSFSDSFLAGMQARELRARKLREDKIREDLTAVGNAKPEEQTALTEKNAPDPAQMTYDSDTGQYVPSLAAIQSGVSAGLTEQRPQFDAKKTVNFLGKTYDTAPTEGEMDRARMTAMAGVYNANGDPVRALELRSQARQGEMQDLQLKTAKRADAKQTSLDEIDKKAGEYMKSRVKMDENGSPVPFNADDFINGSKHRAFLLAEGGHYDEAGNEMRKGFEHQQMKLQAETADRTKAARDAGARILKGDYVGALNVYNQFLPDGANASGATKGKDGSITIERVSTVDGKKLEPIKFKNEQQFAATIEALADPHAASLYLANSWKQDMETRRLGIDQQRVGLEGQRVNLEGRRVDLAEKVDTRTVKKEEDATQALADMDAAERTGDTKAYNDARRRAIKAGVKLDKVETPKADVKVGTMGDITVTQPTGGGGAVVTNYGPDMKSKGSVTVNPPSASAGAPAGPTQRAVGTKMTIQSGPHAGKTAVWDGKGWALEQ